MEVIKHPWGESIILADVVKTRYDANTECDVEVKQRIKLLVINPGQRTSLQIHRNRSEECTVIHGPSPRVTVGTGELKQLGLRTWECPAKMPHRIHNVNSADKSIILEVQTGEPDESDIIRIEDDYGRV